MPPRTHRVFETLVLSLAIAACGAGDSQPPSPGSGSVMSADGVDIRYESHGNGYPALILVHGWSCDRSYWAAQVEPLSRKFRVVTVDLAGHGESGMGRSAWTIDSFGADVAAVADALDLESVVLVGHSMGGDVALQAARRLRGRVAGLIMVDTYKKLGAPRSDEAIDAMVEELAAEFPTATEQFVRSMFPAGSDPALVDRVALDMASAPREVSLDSLRSSFLHAREVRRLIESLGVPVIAINPDDAPTDRVSMTEHGVEVRIMPGVGHFLMMEEPALFNDLLVETVAALR